MASQKLSLSGKGGPAIDCVKIVTDTGISWDPLTENLDHVGKIEA